MKPTHYYIKLEPNLKDFLTKGETKIEIELEQPTRTITLNAKELAIWSCKVVTNNDEINCSFTLKPEEEELIVEIPKEVTGKITLEIEFSGKINDTLLGLYRTRYTVNGETRYAAVTQFEERHARKAFPCFDHPSKKATFDIEYVIDKNLQGISNTPIVKEEDLPNGKKLVKFERTPPMSTYLLFFGIGEFEFLEDKSKEPIVRVITSPGKTKYGDFALDMGRKSLEWGEQYTGVKFPIKKCDYIAVEDFAYGAMENFGAIVFRENALLVYPGLTSKANLLRIATIIAHETAHMWFGDIVSPADWKYIWLNESFASFFTYAIPDSYFPEWKVWNNFVSYVRSSMDRDALRDTIPIELPGEDAQINISSSTAPIIYNKGAGIIWVLEDFLGEEKFKKGIQYFLQKHQFGVATTNDYWSAFEEATGEPVSEFAEKWVYQPGHPIVEAKLEDNILHLRQERFTYLPLKDDKTWLIPITIDFYYSSDKKETKKFVLKDEKMEINVPKDVIAIKINAGQKGYYRVKYDEKLLSMLQPLLLDKILSGQDSYGIENDYFALVKRGDYTTKEYLEFLEKFYINEDRYLATSSIANNIYLLYLYKPSERDEIAKVGLKVLSKALERLGFEPKETDSLHDASLRDLLLWITYLFGDANVATFAREQYNKYINGEKVHPDILNSVLRIGVNLYPDTFNKLLEKVSDPTTPETEKLKLLVAVASLKDENLLKEVLKFNFEKVPKRNQFYALNYIASNPNATSWIWDWFKENFELVRKSLPIAHIDRALISVCPIGAIKNEEEVITFLNNLKEQHPRYSEAISLTIETSKVVAQLSKH